MANASSAAFRPLTKGSVGKLNYESQTHKEQSMRLPSPSPEELAVNWTGFSNGQLYVFNSDLGIELHVQASPASSTGELRDLLIAAWNAEPLYRSLGEAVPNGANVVDVVFDEGATGLDFAQIGGPAHTTITTEALDPQHFPYGICVFVDSDGAATAFRADGAGVLGDLVGISCYDGTTTHREGVSFQDEPEFSQLRTIQDGGVGVLNGSPSTPPARNKRVYVGHTAPEVGKFFTEDAGTRELMPINRMVWWDANTIMVNL